jgi:hypothetical protein
LLIYFVSENENDMIDVLHNKIISKN